MDDLHRKIVTAINRLQADVTRLFAISSIKCCGTCQYVQVNYSCCGDTDYGCGLTGLKIESRLRERGLSCEYWVDSNQPKEAKEHTCANCQYFWSGNYALGSMCNLTALKAEAQTDGKQCSVWKEKP